jgi:hypothetical protein
MKISPVGAELFHANGQSDRHDKTKPLFTILRTRLKTDTCDYTVDIYV